jgi:hypothetical protein
MLRKKKENTGISMQYQSNGSPKPTMLKQTVAVNAISGSSYRHPLEVGHRFRPAALDRSRWPSSGFCCFVP